MPTTRIPVVLRDDDQSLMIDLRRLLEAKYNKSLSQAEIVRIALRKLKEVETTI